MSYLSITNIEKQPEGITISLDNGSDYFISAMGYKACIMESISDWVHQIMGKTWSDIDSLYRLGAMLSEHTNGSKINWEDTFYMVERHENFTSEADEEVQKRVSEKLKTFGFSLN